MSSTTYNVHTRNLTRTVIYGEDHGKRTNRVTASKPSKQASITRLFATRDALEEEGYVMGQHTTIRRFGFCFVFTSSKGEEGLGRTVDGDGDYTNSTRVD